VRRSGFPRRNKMNARRVLFPEHGAFDSGDECKHYQELLLRKSAGEIVSEIQRQVTFPLFVNGIRIGAVRPDFVYTERGNTKPTIDEFKGFDTDLWRWKWRHLCAQHQDEYIFVVSRRKKGRR
jgi:hypothetical protein